jgi:hypothetical protein
MDRTSVLLHKVLQYQWSTRDFLRDFYLRVEKAENYAQRLGKELYEAQIVIH